MGENMSVGHQTNIIKEVLTRELITPQELADTLGVSIASINSWTSGRRNISTKHLRNLKKHYPDSFAKKIKPKEGETNMETINDKNLIIELQQEKIINLEKRLKKQKSDQDNAYGLGTPDCSCEFDIEVDWSGSVSVKYKFNKSHMRRYAEQLGYTENEIINFFGVDKMIPYKNHPIHGLRTPARKKEMISSVSKYVKFFKGFKISATEMTAELPITYNHKDGHDVHCINQYKVNWVAGNGMCNIWFQK